MKCQQLDKLRLPVSLLRHFKQCDIEIDIARWNTNLYYMVYNDYNL